MKPYKLETYS